MPNNKAKKRASELSGLGCGSLRHVETTSTRGLSQPVNLHHLLHVPAHTQAALARGVEPALGRIGNRSLVQGQ